MEARDDEREAPTEAGLYIDGWGNVWRLWRDGIFSMLSSDERQNPRQYAPFTRLHTIAEIESLGYRKHPEPEITDEMVERAVRVMLDEGLDGRSWPGYARAVLEAALRVPVGEGEQ